MKHSTPPSPLWGPSFISSRGTNSQILPLDGVDVALNGVQPVVLSQAVCVLSILTSQRSARPLALHSGT